MLSQQLQQDYDSYLSWWEEKSPLEGVFAHPAFMFAVTCAIAHLATVWAFHISMYTLCRSGWLAQYKIEAKWPTEALVKKALRGKIVGTVLLDWTAWLAAYYFFLKFFKPFIYTEPLPPLGTIVYQIIAFFLINDTLFYWVHRSFHTWPVLYKTFHKQHHEFYQSISLATEYAHPVESLLANVLPMFLGPGLLEVHFVTFLVWVVLRLWESLDAHSGYDFPWSPWRYFRGSSRFHDYHHSHNRGNYGLFPVWDYICGTDKYYREYLSSNKEK